MATVKALKWDGLKASEIFILVATAVVMTAAVVDVAGDTGPMAPPAVERQVRPGVNPMSGAEREEYRRRLNAAATPEDKVKVRADYAAAAKKKNANP